MRLLRPLLLAALLAGCANQYETRRQYLSQFVGRPEADLVLALGVPNRTYETGGIKYLAFDQSRVEFVPGAPMYGPPFWGWGPGAFPPQVIGLACETTVAVRDGIVVSFVLRGNACG
jgi:hypothetical protein